ncbi:Hsp20/alpha crystallin family protein [Streptomyces sp. NBC_01619]|uniref:Hsp20/alpha crystallin family protein n=1 Tax=Streptomyces pratisoli TaxID=3139917 RepID=A0ACC6QAX1_9ACTN|nr:MULTISPECIES: Hsp20/alpha crystallin family protein [unclassified Streptomyces]MCX4510671.1 Hsp20/alpha crystallin family protein [Streptomyces sp. NBC_01619]
MATLARKQKFPFPDLSDWFEAFPARFTMPAMADLHTMRIEEYTEEGRYIVCAELPGIDVKDLDLTVDDGVLTIKAERTEREVDKHRSEFRYGSLTRSLALPKSADENDVRAEYADGMLTVSVGLGEQKPEPKHIEITRTT